MDAQITPEIVRRHGLTEDEYRKIVGCLGRDPNLDAIKTYTVPSS